MEIKLKRGLREPFENINIDGSVTGVDLLQRFGGTLPYKILAMNVNNETKALTEVIETDCEVELLDMRTQAANLIYQRSLSMIYLKAINDIVGDVDVDIQNSLNKGLYTEIKLPQALDPKQVDAISARMQELIDADLPINGTMPNYELDGYKNVFYGEMVPSTGYVEYFELKKYHRGVILRFPYPTEPDKIPEYVDEKKLCMAFGEAKKWHNLLDVGYIHNLNEKVETGQFKEMVLLSEALHEKKISDIADEIYKSRKRIILIAGPSSSGKTTFARRLCIQLKVNGLNPLYLGTDDYFVNRSETPLDENGEPDYENLHTVDIPLFNRQMNDLLAGKEVDLPTFDFIDGKKIFGERITSIAYDQPIVIEGIHALNQELTKYIDDEWKYRIYISPFVQLNMDAHNRIPTTDARLIRRMTRDFRYRGKTAKMTIEEWPKVRKGEDKNIFPFNGEADMLFNSSLAYELCILVKYVKPLLEEIGPEDREYSEAKRLLRMLDCVESVQDDSIVPNNSILKEFIGGSVF